MKLPQQIYLSNDLLLSLLRAFYSPYYLMPVPTHSLIGSPSWQNLSDEEKNNPDLIELCMKEVALMTELKEVRSTISFLSE